MYANTAYEALYEIMGLQFQEEVTRWITSQVIFRACILLIFGVAFFAFLLSFASRYIPVFLPARRAPIAKLVLLVFCLFTGISLLKVDVTTGAGNMNGDSWAQNPYVTSNAPSVRDQYHVSLIFRLLSGAAEEIARALGAVVDSTFSKTHSQMQAPNFFYKALLGAAFDTIDDPKLRSEVDFYTSECLSKALPRFNPDTDSNFLDRYFSRESSVDRELAQIPVGPGPVNQNCLELKNRMNQDVGEYARTRSSVYERAKAEGTSIDKFMQGFGANYENWVTSNLLVNHYLDQREGPLGMEHGTELPGTGGRIIQFINRSFSMDGILSLFGRRDLKGASVAANRSQELSDHLARAPHVAGFLKMLLIGFFPVLVFFLAAGKWRPVLWWWVTYLSICLWAPLWALLYHVITSLALSVETMEAFGRLTDGVSLYAASLVSSRLYQAFAVYSWLQLFVGPALTGSLLMGLRPMLADSTPDRLPEGANTAVGLATKGAGLLL
jgi:hypothetical protein